MSSIFINDDTLLQDEKDAMHQEMLQDALHEYNMRTDIEYFEEHSAYLEQFRESREGLVKELYKYNLELKPEDFL